ncbi:ABC transporter permease subunit [Paenibacillus graminis]|uniref:Uncharacterized protein n=1 Tax=Paenibacillus graminis TaxID=189425 RepID=A0A089M8Z6_9BACL|nr:ABC transporter permease subunit [Paenibacillus graminis]AIQ69732.1 hypothetical protein PGRAT_20450 [Paenibacillus graminis]
MDALTRFELQKITRKRSFLAGIMIVILAALFLTNMMVAGTWIINEDGEKLKGLAAISLRKEYDRKHAGPLTVDKVAEAVKRHKKITYDPKNLNANKELTSEAYAKFEVMDEQMDNLLRFTFSPVKEYDYHVIEKLNSSSAQTFYQKRIEKIIDYLNYDYSYGNYSVNEKDFFIEMNKSIPVPFQMDYVTGWQKVFQSLRSFFLIISFVIAISLAPVFASEYQSGTDSVILSTRYGRNKIITAKFKASFIVTCGVTCIAIGTYTLLLLGSFGFYGADASVQMIDLLSPVPYTVFQTYLWVVFIGILACMLVGAVTLWLSSWMNSPFPVIIAMGIFLIGPLFIPASKSSLLFNQLMDLLPGNMFDGFKKVTGYGIIHVFGQIIPQYKFTIGFAIISIALLLPLTYHKFRKHQVT